MCVCVCVEGSDRREVSVVGRVQSSRMKLLLFILDVSHLKAQNKTSVCAHVHSESLVFVPCCRLRSRHRDDRCRQTDGQLVSEVTGRLHYCGHIRRRHDLLIREHQQIHGSHTGEYQRPSNACSERNHYPDR